MPIIEVKHLTKEYDLGTMTSLKDNIRHTLAKLKGKDTWQRERYKALDDVNFTIEEGEVVGIIGHNGAGKSTLLKHLANITKPTTGEVAVRGSIAPLIEVGAGVNPELTGRENIFLNGAILGIPKKTIQSKLDEIIAFSELEQFIDTPVKRYSSGMTVKLGFSIATSMDADILIIDEVLAVGDLAFQRKCFDRMEEIIKHQGKTVLVVSHNMRQIERLCKRVLLIKNGHIIQDDASKLVCNSFFKESDQIILNQRSKETANKQGADDIFVLEKIRLVQNNQVIENEICHKSNVDIVIDFSLSEKTPHPTFGIGFQTTDFLNITTHNSEHDFDIESLDSGKYQITCTINNLSLLPGIFSIRLGVTSGMSAQKLFYGENLYNIQIISESKKGSASLQRDGFFSIDAKWEKPKIGENY